MSTQWEFNRKSKAEKEAGRYGSKPESLSSRWGRVMRLRRQARAISQKASPEGDKENSSIASINGPHQDILPEG